MRQEVHKLLDKASRAVDAAELLLREGSSDFAASRAYYSMFYAAEALLADRGLDFRRHAGVHRTFGEEFVKPGALDPKLHRWLLDAYDLRAVADYGVEVDLGAEDVRETIARAREFLAAVRTHLGA